MDRRNNKPFAPNSIAYFLGVYACRIESDDGRTVRYAPLEGPGADRSHGILTAPRAQFTQYPDPP